MAEFFDQNLRLLKQLEIQGCYSHMRPRVQGQIGCGQNSVPCGFRTDVPIFLLAVDQRLLSAPRDHILCHLAPSVFKLVMEGILHIISLSCVESLTFSVSDL